uniref:NADH dehydrogenase subunit 6 n=1 Tax=Nesophrosyne sp. 17 GMB-2012 TaxID=1223917 RepID=UPI002182503B|nr:NADH dehydrogenase subunit 6 [Nesophrosyne sp. 17 GMB-2012]UVI59753.1 NADH dehydrogenase subunit 6 [Nesophrosyne sp. 17 GMB-2012]
MKILLMKVMMLVSSYTLTLKTPMSMGIMLLLLTSTSVILLTQVLTTAWIPMIMFLMLVGGLLILFMYMSSIASNEKFTMNIYLLILPMVIIMLPLETMSTEVLVNETMVTTMLNDNMSMIKIYNKKTFIITIFMFMYLLMSMIVITKIIKIFKGPLRSK